MREDTNGSGPAAPAPELYLRRAVVARVTGGLANQLLCYKMAHLVAHWNQASLVLDASWYGSVNNLSERNFQLHHYDIDYDLLVFSDAFVQHLAQSNDITEITGQALLDETRDRDRTVADLRGARIVYGDIWLALMLRAEADRYAAESGLLERLVLDPATQLDDFSRGLLGRINSADEPVAIHVRRGDFATFDGGLLLPVSYYNTAIKDLEAQLDTPVFFVFSDDIPWCKENLATRAAIYFSESNGAQHAYRDLYLASRCRHFILSNESTYSHQIVQLSKPHPGRVVVTSTIADVIRHHPGPPDVQGQARISG